MLNGLFGRCLTYGGNPPPSEGSINSMSLEDMGKLKLIGVDSMWTKPKYEDIRLGFEITMYFKTR